MARSIAMLAVAFAQALPSAPQSPLPEGVYRVGHGVTAPQVTQKVDPDYSEEARLARLQGAAVLNLVVDEHGVARNIRLIRTLGLGLDEKAIDAVSKWQFQPGAKDGEPVAVMVTVEMNFRLLDRESAWHLKRAFFQTPEGTTRPVLESANFPPGPPQVKPASLSVSFDVDPDGVPFNLHVESSSDPSAEQLVMDAVRQWRFHPAMREDTAVAVPARFDFERGTR